ncbi:hypothetical protein FACS189460_5650 [Deltaproteobacteria bacterium]|nr:hypothetical protein FACS189460_5650 [Deltaproteobacteria bacterium]
MTNLTLINSERNWMESSALRQLESLAGYPDVARVVGLPDLHAGRTPVGLAVLSANHIYPYLIGNDIGCGMSLFKTGLPVRKFKLEKWSTQLAKDRDYGGRPVANPFPEESPLSNLGTLGGGNHFLEFQRVEELLDPEAGAARGLDPGEVLLLVHTGSRGFGQRIMAEFQSETGYGLTDPQTERYLELHAQAMV